MTCAPIAIRILERFGYDSSAHIMAWIGFTWMGFIFLFFCTGLLFDLFRFALWLFEGFSARTNYSLFCRIFIFTVPAILSLAITVYGFFEAGHITTTRVAVYSPKIPAGTKIRMVQISDVHLGIMNGRKKLQRIIALIKSGEPDILVSSGDLVDGQKNNIDGLADLLNTIDAPLGKYAVTGNHEYYAGLEHSLNFLKQAGFTVLNGEAAVAGNSITIAGIADNSVGRFKNGSAKIEKQIFESINKDLFTVLLKHRPFVSPGTPYDLQLSGHTHKGQIFPFNLLTRLVYPYPEGRLVFLPGNKTLYTSRGTGTWGPPVRFLSPPEITFIDLLPKE
jgi:predicted MPP superfamily phosphohydrolase